jgi:asparagine synthase (glutamine-hydrolysing)
MCGIAGIVNFQGALESHWIQRMTTVLRHRGPDDEGYLAAGTLVPELPCVSLGGADSSVTGLRSIGDYHGPANLYLGHRRLSILDLSEAGHQPMGRGGLWIVFNGEIYNYMELREELKAAGYGFSTATDTEVILAAYDCWGQDCAKRFNGDWALAIFDARRRLLILSRDRYGVKPLYFFETNGFFAFASEIKALLAVPRVPHAINREKAFEYRALFCHDHTEETLFDGIRQLAPGQNMTLELQTGRRDSSRYYRLTTNYAAEKYDHRKALDYANDVRELLTDSVRLRLRADVPVGTCLSGGLDSSAVVAIMSRLVGAKDGRLNTFTASFPGEAFDESRFARLVAEHTRVQSRVLYPTKEGYWQEIDRVLYHQDEPFGGASIYSEWAVMREAAKHVKVVLDGHGGDEVFAGYKDYRLSFLADLLARRRWLTFLRELAHVARMHPERRKFLGEMKSLPIYFLGQRGKRIMYRLYYRREIGASRRSLNLARPAKLDQVGEKFAGNLNALLLHYMTTYTLPYLLRGEDRCCMAHSVEARVPFTDYRLVDYVFSIPAAYKIHDGWTKWLLRLAVSDLLPGEIVWRREKFGFATPRWATREDEWNLWLAQHFAREGRRDTKTRLPPPQPGKPAWVSGAPPQSP